MATDVAECRAVKKIEIPPQCIELNVARAMVGGWRLP